jgi:hypothetical protein
MKNHPDRLWIAAMVTALSAAAVSAQPQATGLQVIATMPVKGITPDVVDDHYYKRE